MVAWGTHVGRPGGQVNERSDLFWGTTASRVEITRTLTLGIRFADQLQLGQ